MSAGAAQDPRSGERSESRRQVVVRQGRALLEAIRNNDEAAVEEAVLALSQSRRIFAPLVFALGAFVMLFQGLKMLFSNWKLTLIQLLPAMWIWLALLDLKAHTFNGKEFHAWHGGVQLLLILAIVLLTTASYYLNAVFAFAISQPGRPRIRPGFALARRHLWVILGVGIIIGLALGVSVVVVPRWGKPWFTLSLGIVVGVMMLTYVTVPARLVGVKPVGSRRDKMAAAASGGTRGVVFGAASYVVGLSGLLLLASKPLFGLGIFLLVIGFALMAGATGAVKAIKMSAKLAAGKAPARSTEPPVAAGRT